MNVRIAAPALAAALLVTACAHSQESKPTPTPGPVVFVPRTAATPAHRAAPHVSATAQPARPNLAVSASASPASTASATPAPLRATPAPIPSANTQAPVATTVPNVALPSAIIEPPNAPPQILAVELSTPQASGGQVVSGTVQTSSNVASVEARVGGQSRSLQKVDVGRFTISYRVPTLPFFLHKTYLIQIIARNAAGVAVSTAVPITLR